MTTVSTPKPLKREKIEASKENLIKALETIKWKVVQRPYAGYIFNHKGKYTHWLIMRDRLELEDLSGSFDESPSICFYFKDCYIEWIEDTTVSLVANGAEGVFIFFANYSLKEEVQNEKTLS